MATISLIKSFTSLVLLYENIPSPLSQSLAIPPVPITTLLWVFSPTHFCTGTLYTKLWLGYLCCEKVFLGRKAMANLESTLKSRDITLPTKVHTIKAMVFE